MEKIVYLVDDDRGFLESASWWLQGLGFLPKGYANPLICLGDLRDADDELRCFLVDVRMPECNGLEFFQRLRRSGEPAPVIFLTGHGDVPLAVEAMRRGALTFLQKPIQEGKLEEALNSAFQCAAGLSRTREAEEAFRTRLESLTKREREVLERIVNGKMNKVIAGDLDISVKTVEVHRKRVMEKMRAQSLPHLVTMMATKSLAS